MHLMMLWMKCPKPKDIYYRLCRQADSAQFYLEMVLCASGKQSYLWEAARHEGSCFIENQSCAFWCGRLLLRCLLILMTAWPWGGLNGDGAAWQVSFMCVCAACQEAYSKLLEQEACSTGCASQPAEPEIKRRKVRLSVGSSWGCSDVLTSLSNSIKLLSSWSAAQGPDQPAQAHLCYGCRV